MRRILIFFIFFKSFLSFGQDIPEKPNPPKLVNDFVGGLLSDAQKQALEQKLVAYNDSTSTQITVVIIKSVEPYDIGDYALQLGRKWGVGQEGKNNGIVLLWAPGDRKVTIQTGYGMEGVLPDMYAKRIISDVIAPNFKAVQYYQGLDQATSEIMRYASGEYTADPAEDGDAFLGFFIILIIAIFVIWVLYKIGKNGGGGNDNGTPFTTYTGWGRQSGNFGGGWSSGGGGWSGGGGGGGFGGFGGGSFGGGGASGGY
ncbi:TPM domain-containing protein [Lacihabitans sp. LS3-19]|uniref:TPM domain-containing protein n=1 Tax=Lacihabitans sp. LS3-19 TaxID=2487335 RepID=UPI0020CE432D|nr:TPM domain-containing protein [Lacihabitans sp. LS3-19]MCP9767489.1 TPM domain-containing protein [Lacihabitans sp. LS3-19]